ncbi:MAG: hypothetical protein ACRDTD_12145 [Pseudonocardiaceae bacterium]
MTQQLPDANAFLFGGGVPSAKFDTIGAIFVGTIKQPPATQQQTDFDTGALKFWDDGRAMLQVVVTCDTAERDPQVDDDDGTRKLYIRGKHLTNAVKDAVRHSGLKVLEVGGTLAVSYVGDDEPKRRGMDGAKQYTATYTPAAANALSVDATPEPPAAPPAPPANTATNAPEINAAFAKLSAEQRQAALAQMTPEQIAALFPIPAAPAVS